MNIEVKNLIKIFGKNPKRGLDMLKQGISKDEIREKTGQVVGVADVSFSVKSSEMFVVMGLSGSGKSTLLRCINRLHEPTSGTVALNGNDITKLSMDQVRELRREKMGMVFQKFALYPHRTIIENVGFGLEVQGIKKEERVKLSQQAIELVGLAGYEEQYPPQLSGGMQQRVGLARALAMDPEILLMDEPFSALDPLIRKEMQDELIKLQSKMNKTIIFITHDLDEALRLGDKIAIMKDGVIVQIGTPEDILTNPEDDYVTKFTEGVDRTKILTAESIMKEPVETVTYGKDGVNVALRKMKKFGLSSILVVDEDNELKGGLLPDDLVKAKNQGLAIKDVLIEDVGRVGPDTSIRELLNIATDTPFPLAVNDEDGRLQGIIVRSYVLEALSRRGEI